ncbi:hypothetical protein, conserved [Eimeria praecox]|uniref:Uncharacterized protein n=1 Tax=Eimeria praecox TaxID=51316 RepID=U6GVZ8_9EIME|nr:hypothetical protein, conserved [Eimeria praecox]
MGILTVLQHLMRQCKACVDSSIAVLEEKLNYHEEGRNTSQETTPGTESRVTSSPISFMCLASTTAGEDEHRAIVSTPPNLDSQGNQKEEEFVNVKNIVQDKQREAHCSLIALRTEPRGEDDHRAVVATVPSPGTHESHEEQMGVISAPKATRKDRISSIHHFSHEHTVGEGAEPNAASIQLVKPDDTQESLGDARVRKANSKAMKRKPCPNKNSRTHNEANPGQTAGAAADPCAVGDSTVLDVGSVESGLKSKEQEGEPLAPQNGDKQAESAKSVRKNKRKKTSKAKGKRRHGKTGRR